MYIIYKATHKITNKVYVGRTTQLLQQRIGQHWGLTKSKWKKFHQFLHTTKMEDWTWEVLHNVGSKKEAENCEMYYINLWNLYVHGLNTPTGLGGEGQASSRLLASERMKRYKKENPEPWHKGRTGVYSEESLELMSLAKLRNPTRRIYTEIDKLNASLAATNSKHIVELKSLLKFNSISAASRHFKIRREAVRDVVNGKRNHTGGLVFVEEGSAAHTEWLAKMGKFISVSNGVS